MKLLTLITFLAVAASALAADKRIKDITTTATSPASDDYLAIDGVTNGTRKMLPAGASIRPDSAMGALEVSTSPRIVNTVTLTGTTATLTFSAAPTAGTTFYLRLTGHSADSTVTIPSSFSYAQGAAITTFVAKANVVYEISWSYSGSTYYIVGEPPPLTITSPAAATTLTVASGSSLATAGAYTSTVTMTANSTVTLPTTGTLATLAGTEAFTNKTLDANGTGNVLKLYGYIQLTHPTVFASGTTQQTTVTSRLYGQALFGNATDKATNYVEYVLVVPDDIDTSVDLTGVFHFILGGADTGDFEYEISMIDVAASAVYDTAAADAVSLAFTADASGADKDVQKTTSTTLTGWAAALTAGSVWYIRVARDGDHASDTSTVNSYSGPLVIRYGITQ